MPYNIDFTRPRKPRQGGTAADRTMKNDPHFPRPVAPSDTQNADATPGGSPSGATQTTTEALLDKAPKPRREEVSALETRILVNEMQCLVGGYLDKAYQPTREEVLLRFRTPEFGRRDLFYRRGRYLCFTENKPANPTHPTGFAMALRKYACGGKVFKVEQMGYDRVVSIWVQKKEGEFRIVFELLGEGNCVLVRPDGKILVPLVQEAWASRTIRGGAPYIPPPARDDPLGFDEETFVTRAAAGERDLVRALAVNISLGGPTAEEVLARAGLDKKKTMPQVSEEELRAAYAAWRDLVAESVEGTPEARLLCEEERPIDFAAHRSIVLEREAAASDGRKTLRAMPSASAAIDTLYLSGRKADEVAEEVQAVGSRLTKLERQKQAQEAALEKFAKEIDEKALQGEALFAHYQTVEKIRDNLLAARKHHDWKEIQRRVEAGKKEGNPDALLIERIDSQTGTITLRLTDPQGNMHKVPINISKNITENAQAAYERSKTARNKLAGARVALASTLEKMAAATTDRQSAEAAVEDAMFKEHHLVPSNRHWWFEAFRWFWTTSGELVVGGRDAATNDRLVKKHLEEGDRYVHADLHGAPSLVVKAPSAETAPSEEGLEQAAQVAVTYSRAFGQSGSGDAYWVSPPQVSKTPQAGEFLARGAFIVRGERNWFRKLSLTASLGLVWLDADGRPTAPPEDISQPGRLRPKLMGGAPTAVHHHSERWVDVVAGQEKRSVVVKRLAKAFAAHPDVVDRSLPPGDLRIVGTKGIHLEEETA